MKKRLIAAFLCLALLCALLPGTALAAGTQVWIAGKLLNIATPYFYSDGTGYKTSGTLPATVTRYAYFDTANNVLYVRSLEVLNWAEAVVIDINGTITLNLADTSTVTMDNNSSASRYGLRVQNGDLTVTGSGTLNVTCDAADSASYGVYTTGSITVNGGTLTGTGGAATTQNTQSYGVYAESGSITVKDGTLNGTGGNVGTGTSGSIGVYTQAGSITVEGGELSGTGATNAPNSYGVFAKGSITVTGGGCDGTGGSTGVRCLGAGGITVSGGTLNGEATNDSTDNSGVHCDTSVTISGTGRVEATSVSTSIPTHTSYGVHASQITVSGDGFLHAHVESSSKTSTLAALHVSGGLTTNAAGLLALGSWYSSGRSPVVYDNSKQNDYLWVKVDKVGVTVTPSTSFPAGNAGMDRTVTVDSGVANFNATNNYSGATLGGHALDLGTGVGAGGEHGSFDDGSIVITLNAAYLNTLTPGTYPLVVTLKDGTGSTGYAGKQATTNIVVTGAPPVPPAPAAASVPKTGDGSAPYLWLGLALLAGAGLLVSRAARKRKETH